MKRNLTSDLHEEAWSQLNQLFRSIISPREPQEMSEDVDEEVTDDDSSDDTALEEYWWNQRIELDDDRAAQRYRFERREINEDPSEDRHYEQYVIKYHLDKESLANELDACATSILNNLAKKDVVNLRADFDGLISLCEELDIHHEDTFESIDSCLDILNVSEGGLIYLPKHDPIYTPQLILTVHSDLIRLIARNPNLIFEISPRQFEEIIAELFLKKGFEVELTKQTRDGGRDIIAVSKEMDVRTKYLIECKRYARTRNVSVGIVQRLFGVKVAESANKAILATTSGFTKDARKFANSHLWDLDLKDFNDIMSWIRTHPLTT